MTAIFALLALVAVGAAAGSAGEVPRQSMPKGGESRVIRLSGVGTRSVRKVVCRYDTKGLLKEQAGVTLFGMP